MTSRIKPGTLCVVVSAPDRPMRYASQWLGQIVTATESVPEYPGFWLIEPPLVIVLSEPAIDATGREFGPGVLTFANVHERHLRPLHDPDQDLADETTHPLAEVAARALDLASIPQQ